MPKIPARIGPRHAVHPTAKETPNRNTPGTSLLNLWSNLMNEEKPFPARDITPNATRKSPAIMTSHSFWITARDCSPMNPATAPMITNTRENPMKKTSVILVMFFFSLKV